MTALGSFTSDGSGLVPLNTSPVVFIFKVTTFENGQAHILVQASVITIVDSIIIIVVVLYIIRKNETQMNAQHDRISAFFPFSLVCQRP